MKNIIVWKNEYSMKNRLIDEQHKKLIEIINSLISNGSGEKEKISKTIYEMLQFADQHFDSEVDYMEQINYPERELHKSLHKEYKKKIADFCIEAIDGKENLQEKILIFMKEWFEFHVLNEDMKIKEFVEQRS